MTGDPEIAAMADINRLLEPFDNKTRRRMLEWVIAYQAELPVACIPEPSRGRAQTEDEIGPTFDQLADAERAAGLPPTLTRSTDA